MVTELISIVLLLEKSNFVYCCVCSNGKIEKINSLCINVWAQSLFLFWNHRITPAIHIFQNSHLYARRSFHTARRAKSPSVDRCQIDATGVKWEVELMPLIYHLVVSCHHDPEEISLILPLSSQQTSTVFT